MRGRSSRSSKLRVSVGEPASRSSSAPTSRSVSACAIASSSSIGAVLRPARRGSARRRGRARSSRRRSTVSASFDRFGAQRAVDDPSTRPARPLRQHHGSPDQVSHALRASAAPAVTSGPGTSASTSRCRPGRAAARPDPAACSTESGKPAGILSGHQRVARLRRRRAPPPFLPFLPLARSGGLADEPLRPNGIPIWPAICDIILRASKNRSTSWLTSPTVDAQNRWRCAAGGSR